MIFLKKNLLLIVTFCLMFVVFISLILLPKKSVPPTPTSLPTSKPSPTEINDLSTRIDAQPGLNQNKPTASDIKQFEKDYQVGQLVKKLPYSQKEFSLNYDFAKNSFIVKFDKINLSESQKAFNLFLKQNKIESSDWLYNLKVE